MTELNLAADFEDRKRVPNEFPSVHSVDGVDIPYRIAVIGEAPGQDEETFGRPFVGQSGWFLDNILSNVGILRSACYVGNICQIRPPANDIKRFSWDGTEIQEGLKALRNDLTNWRPNIVLLLGNAPLRAAMGEGYQIGDYRGSLFICDDAESPFFGLKCVGTYHPANVQREYENMPLFKLDCKRARMEGEAPELILPQRNIRIDMSAMEIALTLQSWPQGKPMSVDIEGGLAAWTTVGIASGPFDAFVISWSKYSLEEEIHIIREFSRCMADPGIPKIFQNGLYDCFVLEYGFKMLIRGITQDTMVKGWEIYSELPKGLDTQASIYTKQPQWKHLIAYSLKERKKRAAAGVDPINEARNKMIACGIDCSVTYEISNAQDKALENNPRGREHYNMNIDLLSCFRFMELRGIRYDVAAAAEQLQKHELQLKETQTRLEVRAGMTLNMASPKQVAEFLYQRKGFEPVYKKEHGRNTTKVTTNVDALLTLVRKYDEPILYDMLLIRRLAKQAQSLRTGTDPDLRVRCGYNEVGTETGRITCYTSPTGSGENLQTVTKKFRRFYLADIGKYFFQCDLEGADGWTVAARCASLGDRTMLDDYLAGIKPARIIALMYEKGISIGAMDRDALYELSLSVDKDGWLYFACKRVQHGTNYGLGPITMSGQIQTDSYKMNDEAIWVPPKQCKQLQQLYVYGRYGGINRWHEWATDYILDPKRGGLRLTSASGHTRIFFGRRRDGKKVSHDMLRDFLADEPQEITTYATNKAAYNLWTDKSNRIESYFGVGSSTYIDGLLKDIDYDEVRNLLETKIQSIRDHIPGESGLLIEPLHQVHDALCGQFDTALLPWARPKIKSYFNNRLEIAGLDIVIPYDGGYGPSWSELGKKKDTSESVRGNL